MNNQSSQQSENSLFRWFVMGWMSIAGVLACLYMVLGFLEVNDEVVQNIMCFAPFIFLGLLIYSYVKNKDVLLKRLCVAYLVIGLPFILLMFVAPMMMG